MKFKFYVNLRNSPEWEKFSQVVDIPDEELEGLEGG